MPTPLLCKFAMSAISYRLSSMRTIEQMSIFFHRKTYMNNGTQAASADRRRANGVCIRGAILDSMALSKARRSPKANCDSINRL